MSFIFRRDKCLPYFLLFGIVFAYIVLSWLQIVPSVLQIPVIRKVWDKEFSSCMLHIEKELSLPYNQRKPYYITAKLSGRLGNWMFAYASLLGIAKKNNVKFFTRPDADRRVSLPDIFKVKHVKFISPMCSQSVREKLACAYDQAMEVLPLSNVTIHGYLQSWKFFKNVEDEVRREFTFHDNLLSKAKKIFHFHAESKNSGFQHTICIHARRTDMMIQSSIKSGFKAAPVEYFFNAVQYFRKRFDNKVKFLVISDDFLWCSRNLNFSDTVIIPKNSKEIDLALMSLCDHSIITTGTYGWWGAWLANGHTVYYKNYPEPGTRLDRETVKEDFYPSNWIPIDSSSNLSQSFIIMIISVLFTLIAIS